MSLLTCYIVISHLLLIWLRPRACETIWPALFAHHDPTSN
ncbi:hypothetical protein SAMN04490179_5094 [Pseudomonas antarctica]|uniref:Uncharacterized protein n=1 Tax=Pseudomonas antarctica TaxID=219572 RepID=A0A1H0CVE1_9PSED|nr:hypothetical protein PSAN_54090 [Pseudomonas antarctica]SDN61872.1 hypothetical protein SAMN04490179_5094 [Pseudomonas antarctica]